MRSMLIARFVDSPFILMNKAQSESSESDSMMRLIIVFDYSSM